MTIHDVERFDLTADELPEWLRVFGESGTGAASLDLHGRAELLRTAGVGLCGSRDASEQGIAMAQAAGATAANLDMPLISGYARGVDTAGHVAALSAGGSTIAVLAEGIERFRLREEYRGFDTELDKLTVVSQFPPGAGWSVHRAMARNALICALSAVIVVVEPRESGGTIAAAREALRTSRDGRKQPQPLVLVLRHDHSDADSPTVARLRRHELVRCVETADELASAIEDALLQSPTPQAARLL